MIYVTYPLDLIFVSILAVGVLIYWLYVDMFNEEELPR